MTNDVSLEDRVKEILVDVLAVEPEDLLPKARFFGDLDGESIEVLELSFQLEKKLGIKVDFAKVLGGGDVKIDEHGVVTADSLRRLSESYPFLRIDQVGPAPTPEDMKSLLTVDVITHFVRLAAE